jgi:hypothetical protein
LFEAWLTRHFPDRKEKVLGRIREMHGGKLNDARFGLRMRGQGPMADLLADLFRLARRQAGIGTGGPQLTTTAFRNPEGSQRLLFE